MAGRAGARTGASCREALSTTRCGQARVGCGGLGPLVADMRSLWSQGVVGSSYLAEMRLVRHSLLFVNTDFVLSRGFGLLLDRYSLRQ